MSFCQKHLNHHCHHAHNCKNPSHKNKKVVEIIKIKEEEKPPFKTGLNTCNFYGGTVQKYMHGQQEYIQIMKDQQKNIQVLKKQAEEWRVKYEQSQQENKHLHAQIQYYRQQFGSLIDTNTTDARLEIKKRIKETTELSLRVKVLETENNRLSIENQELKRSIHDDKALRQHNKHINGELENKYQNLHHQMKVSIREKEQLKQELGEARKKNNRMQDNYNILRKQFNLECEKYKKQKDNLTRQLQTCRKQLNKLKSSSQKDKEIADFDRNSSQKRQAMYKQKLSQYENMIEQLTNKIKQLDGKCQELTQDLYHAKAIIQKQTLSSEQFKKVQNQLQQHHFETKTVIREQKHSSPISNKENSHYCNTRGHINEGEQKLRQQIESLKQQIIHLESKNTAHFEQVIMNIGASGAFRKLLEEKNILIKKLMREKGQILTRAFNNRT